MTFRLHHHNKILTILESLDCEVLRKGSAYFGGGTLLALDFEEYRWSKDIDFIASVGLEGYKYLRTVIDQAEKAYEVIRPLKKAIERFQERPDYRQKCFQDLQVDEAQIPKIIDGVDLLSIDLGLSHTPRVFREQHDIFADLETEKEKQEDS